MSMNEVKISGKIKKSNLKYLKDGKAVCNASLCTMYQAKGKDPVFSYFPITAWAKIAEQIAESDEVVCNIEGFLKMDAWTSPEGKKFSKTSIVVQKFERVESSGSGETSNKKPIWDGSKASDEPAKKAYAKPPVKEEAPVQEEETPF